MVTAIDNDPLPSVSISNFAPTSMNEADGMVSIPIIATGKWQDEFSVGVTLDEGLFDFLIGANKPKYDYFPC